MKKYYFMNLLVAVCLLLAEITGVAGATTYKVTTIGKVYGGGASAMTGRGLSLNDSGQMVGTIAHPTGGLHAFLWENGIMTDLHSGAYLRSFSYGIKSVSKANPVNPGFSIEKKHH